MENTIKLPKQLKPDGYSSTTDEKGMPVMWIANCQDHIEKDLRKAIIDRYNNYPAAVTVAITMTVLTGVLAILLFVF